MFEARASLIPAVGNDRRSESALGRTSLTMTRSNRAAITYRVSISLDTKNKHTLPVDESCPWYHPNSIWKGKEVCRTRDGNEIRSYADLLSCFEEAGCRLTGDTRRRRQYIVCTYMWQAGATSLTQSCSEGPTGSDPDVLAFAAVAFSVFM